MGIVKDAELRKGKAELVRALAAKGVAAQPYESLAALAAKVAGAGGGGDPGGVPERFGGAVLVPPLPGLSVAAVLGAPPVTWNPSDKSSYIALSNGDLTGKDTQNNTWHAARATRGRSAGKYYFECITSGPAGFGMAGIALASASLETYAGAAGGFSYGTTGEIYSNGSNVAAGKASWASAGAVMGVAVNLDSQTVTFYCNNVEQYQIAGYLVAGQQYFPIMSAVSLCDVTARFTAASFIYSPPSGYSAWDS